LNKRAVGCQISHCILFEGRQILHLKWKKINVEVIFIFLIRTKGQMAGYHDATIPVILSNPHIFPGLNSK
jgi:hypothetical protein